MTCGSLNACDWQVLLSVFEYEPAMTTDNDDQCVVLQGFDLRDSDCRAHATRLKNGALPCHSVMSCTLMITRTIWLVHVQAQLTQGSLGTMIKSIYVDYGQFLTGKPLFVVKNNKNELPEHWLYRPGSHD